MALAQTLEQLAGLGTFLVSVALAALSYVAWRRERDRGLLVVTLAYLLFGAYGIVVFAEYFLVDWRVLTPATAELLEHSAAFLILIGLLAFFFAMTRE